MVSWCPTIQKTEGGEANSTANKNIGSFFRLAVGIVKFHYLFLVPITLLSITPQALLGLDIPIIIIITVAGVVGNLFARKRISTLASLAILSLVVWGRVADDLLRVGPPETSVFLVEFGMALFLMEANLLLQTFEAARRFHKGKTDELSTPLEARLWIWLRTQFSRQGKIAIGSLGISLALVPLAGFTSISSQELPLTGALLLIAVIALIFLVTYRREPEKRPGR